MHDLILNWTKGTAAASAPAAIYVSLWDGDTAGAGTDVTTTIRAAGRVAATWGAVTDGAFSNSAIIDYGNADAGATISYFAIHDAESAGNMLASAAVTSTKTVSTGDSVEFPVGDLDITVA